MSEQHSMHARRRQRGSAISHALVAAAALAVGVALGTVIPREPPALTSVTLASTGIIPLSNPLHDALQQVPSGMVRQIETGVVVEPVLSYRALSGIWCRRFELRAVSGRTEAVACRGTEAWRIAALTTGPGEEQNQSVLPARESVIDAAVAATIDGDPLEAQDELEAMVDDWQPADFP